jgi:hypothetical protein
MNTSTNGGSEMKRFLYVAIAGSLLLLTACSGGGGGGGGGATKAVVTLLSSGTGTICGIDATVDLPAGVTLKSSASGTTDDGVVVPSGAAATNTYAVGVYTAATGTFPGKIRVLMVNAAGFTPGEFCTVNAELAPGYFPAAADFTIESFAASDETGSVINGMASGLTVAVQ